MKYVLNLAFAQLQENNKMIQKKNNNTKYEIRTSYEMERNICNNVELLNIFLFVLKNIYKTKQ